MTSSKPVNFVDIHTHILPGIDDGAKDMEESLRIIKKGMEEGIRAFVLTPHIKDRSDWETLVHIKARFETLKFECAKRSIDIELILGAELMITPDLPELVLKNPDVTFGGKRKYLLIELPFYQLPLYADEVFFNLLSKGLTPIIAHPERYFFIKKNSKTLNSWVENGILFQMNAGSLTGRYGFFVKRRAIVLLKNGFVHFLGSDIHAYNEKYSLLAHALRIVEKTAGQEIRDRITSRAFEVI